MKKTLKKQIIKNYDLQTSPYYAASRLWIDQIIHPLDTRKYISVGIEASNNNKLRNLKLVFFRLNI